MDSADKSIPLFETFCRMSTNPVCIETVKCFVGSICVEALDTLILSHSLKVRYDHSY